MRKSKPYLSKPEQIRRLSPASAGFFLSERLGEVDRQVPAAAPAGVRACETKQSVAGPSFGIFGTVAATKPLTWLDSALVALRAARREDPGFSRLLGPFSDPTLVEPRGWSNFR
jgi:hypothetical protein